MCISKENLIVADVLFLQFCCRVTCMYGTEVLTSNICLHRHKCECIEDYMPVQGFWLFSFEWFNGMLSKQPNNNKCIKVQLIHRLTRNLLLRPNDLPSEYRSTLESIWPFAGTAVTSTISDS